MTDDRVAAQEALRWLRDAQKILSTVTEFVEGHDRATAAARASIEGRRRLEQRLGLLERRVQELETENALLRRERDTVATAIKAHAAEMHSLFFRHGLAAPSLTDGAGTPLVRRVAILPDGTMAFDRRIRDRRVRDVPVSAERRVAQRRKNVAPGQKVQTSTSLVFADLH